MIGAVLQRPLRDFRIFPAGMDMPLVITVTLLASLGLVMVASASVSYAEHNYGDGLYFVRRHLIYMVMALIAGMVVLQVPVKALCRGSNLIVLASLMLLLLVLVPGVGREVNGARRWIGLGVINLQVAELAKLAAIIYIAAYIKRHPLEIREIWYNFLRPLSVIVAMAGILMLQPDFGSSVVILATVMGLFFLAGVRLWVFTVLLGAAAGFFALLAVASPYRMQRLVSFLDPWSDQFDSGYQLVMSLIAFGRGEWFGVGLGNSVQKLFYLPEAHTDFVFSIFAEEMGMFGVVLLIGLFVFLVHRIFAVARQAVQRQDWFCVYLVFGIGIMLAGQAFINIGVTSGLLPTKGLTLPFISYGGSSLIVSACMIALVLRVGAEMHESRWTSGRIVDDR